MAKFQSYGTDYILRDYLTSLEFTLLTESQIAMAQALVSDEITKDMKEEYRVISKDNSKINESSELLLKMMDLGGYDLNTINVNYDKVISTLITTPTLEYNEVQELPAVLVTELRAYVIKLLLQTNEEIAEKNKAKKD